MEVVIIARDGLADRLVQMVRSGGADATVHERWTAEVAAQVLSNQPALIILEPELRSAADVLPDRLPENRLAIAYLVPDGPRDLWENDGPIAFLPHEFDAGDIRTLLQTAREVLSVPAATHWSLSPKPQWNSATLPGVVAGAAILLAGLIAYRLPGYSQWTADTSTTPYLLVGGLTLLAAGLLLKLSRPLASGAQFAVVSALVAMSTE